MKGLESMNILYQGEQKKSHAYGSTTWSRYPSSDEGPKGKISREKLEFLSDWTYKLGEEILVPCSQQELFDAGILN